jgi:hypothetical protein
MLNKPHFEAVEIVSIDAIFSKHNTSDIAKRIGLPVTLGWGWASQQWQNNMGSAIVVRQALPVQTAARLY